MFKGLKEWLKLFSEWVGGVTIVFLRTVFQLACKIPAMPIVLPGLMNDSQLLKRQKATASVSLKGWPCCFHLPWADFPGSISAAFCDEENCRRVCLQVSLILIFSIFINWPLECLHRRMQHIGTCFFVCRFESKDFFLKASGIFFSRKVSLVRKHH